MHQSMADTNTGRVSGFLEENGTICFRGIPYGAATGGTGRFLPPRPAPPWTHVRDCTAWGSRSRQGILPFASRSGSDAPDVDQAAAAERMRYMFELHGGDYLGKTGDDCLNLNVWSPALDNARRPVMVWFHGGGYISGSANSNAYLGDHLSRRGDVVVVTVNHRLAADGFLHLADVGGSAWQGSGNAGVLDLVLSLEWVRDNIEAFGGDPTRVMIFGQSGGGGKVSALLAMPSARGLFHRAAIQSGPAIRCVPGDEATELTIGILQELNIPQNEIHRIQSVHPRLIAEAADRVNERQGTSTGFAPVIDGLTLPTHPFDPVAAPTQHDVPVIVGCTRDEFTFFQAFHPRFGHFSMAEVRPKLEAMWGARCDEFVALLQNERPYWTPSLLLAWASNMYFQTGTFLLAERKAVAGGAPAYAYLLSWKCPALGGLLCAPHNLCIPMVFDNNDRAPYLGDDPNGQALGHAMCDAWIEFARTGNPNHVNLPDWPAYDIDGRHTMVFDTDTHVANDPEGSLRTAFAHLPPGI